MSDILFLLLIAGSFAVLLAFVGWCERITDGGASPQSAAARTGAQSATARTLARSAATGDEATGR